MMRGTGDRAGELPRGARGPRLIHGWRGHVVRHPDSLFGSSLHEDGRGGGAQSRRRRSCQARTRRTANRPQHRRQQTKCRLKSMCKGHCYFVLIFWLGRKIPVCTDSARHSAHATHHWGHSCICMECARNHMELHGIRCSRRQRSHWPKVDIAGKCGSLAESRNLSNSSDLRAICCFPRFQSRLRTA